MQRCSKAEHCVTCFDCGASELDGDLRTSWFGGDHVCSECESTRTSQVKLHGLLAVVCDPADLMTMQSYRPSVPF
jgi:hypothetical protein